MAIIFNSKSSKHSKYVRFSGEDETVPQISSGNESEGAGSAGITKNKDTDTVSETLQMTVGVLVETVTVIDNVDLGRDEEVAQIKEPQTVKYEVSGEESGISPLICQKAGMWYWLNQNRNLRIQLAQNISSGTYNTRLR